MKLVGERYPSFNEIAEGILFESDENLRLQAYSEGKFTEKDVQQMSLQEAKLNHRDTWLDMFKAAEAPYKGKQFDFKHDGETYKI